MDKVTCERAVNSKALTLFMVTSMLELITRRKALPGLFLCIFSSLTYMKKPIFQQARSSEVEGTSQAVVGFSDQRRPPASVSLFRKSEKI
jgi:hypothetical protein